MPDYRTKRQKLEAMANQAESPHEAEVAKKKLAAMGGPKYGEKVRPSASSLWGKSFWGSPMMEPVFYYTRGDGVYYTGDGAQESMKSREAWRWEYRKPLFNDEAERDDDEDG